MNPGGSWRRTPAMTPSRNRPLTGRRGFLGTVLLGAVPLRAALQGPQHPASDIPRRASDGSWDLSWIDRITGRHRQVFDVYDITNGEHSPLRVVRNYIRAHQQVANLSTAEISTLLGVAYGSHPLVFGDALWRKYHFGMEWKIKDPRTGRFATSNVYTRARSRPSEADFGFEAMQERGTSFWLCGNALRLGLAQELGCAYQAV